ncbi:MAG: molybdenum cofactor guanylyltransferase [Gemmatimonadaceae bacterium]|nr:molybdenum cofactor guanylyltransferase [Gemmatimonadaceae bacterium]
MSCTGVILAGGRATRYDGRAKGLERVGGERIIDRVASALRETTDRLIVIANAPQATEWLPGVPAFPDVVADAGALGGVHAALHHARDDVLLVAWDMPFVPAALLAALRARGEADADLCVPESAGSGRGVEPLCAWYSARCLPPVAARLAAGDLRVVSFHADVRAARLSAAEVARFGDPALLFSNVNAPEDLVAAESRAQSPTARDRR